MPAQPVHITIPQTYQRLIALESLVEHMSPWGMTRRGLIALLRALSVPCIHIGRRRLVDPFVFSLALHAALRLGQPDLLAPGCTALRKGKPPSGLPGVTTLSPDYLAKHLTICLEEMAIRSQIANPQAADIARTTARAAASRMAQALLSTSIISRVTA